MYCVQCTHMNTINDIMNGLSFGIECIECLLSVSFLLNLPFSAFLELFCLGKIRVHIFHVIVLEIHGTLRFCLIKKLRWNNSFTNVSNKFTFNELRFFQAGFLALPPGNFISSKCFS